jgi:hypothetical protein
LEIINFYFYFQKHNKKALKSKWVVEDQDVVMVVMLLPSQPFQLSPPIQLSQLLPHIQLYRFLHSATLVVVIADFTKPPSPNFI